MITAVAQSTFTLRFRNGIWRVKLNGVFFADYRSESDARDGIAEAQRHMSVPAKIVLDESDGI